jgi:hypothetical protein
LRLVGRKVEQEIIKQALDSVITDHQTRVLVVRGDGGLGKTRLLKFAIEYAHSKSLKCSGVIDLFHPENHSNSGIERGILLGGDNQDSPSSPIDSTGIDPQSQYSAEYWNKRDEYRQLRLAGIHPNQLEPLRVALSELFVKIYNELVTQFPNQAILLTIDTTELIQFENDTVQQICQIEEGAVEVKTWLTTHLPRLQNTLIILAGQGPRRDHKNDPRIKLWADIEQAFTFNSKIPYQVLELSSLRTEDVTNYFDAVLEANIQQRSANEVSNLQDYINGVKANPNYLSWLHTITEGRPILLGLVVELLFYDLNVWELLEKRSPWSEWIDAIVRQMVDSTMASYPVNDLLTSLLCARQGLNSALLQRMVSEWSQAECDVRLAALRRLSFIKMRPNTDDVYLHDEVYRMLLQEVLEPNRQNFTKQFDVIIGYIEQELRQLWPIIARQPETEDKFQLESRYEQLEVALLHYMLRRDPEKGLDHYYRNSEAIIRAHQTGLDMKLRDEVLRFLDEHKVFAERTRWPRIKIDRENSINWIKRHLARNDNERAIQVAELILAAGPQEYRTHMSIAQTEIEKLSESDQQDIKQMFATDDPIFWANLLVEYGEALAYTGNSERSEKGLYMALELFGDKESHHG